MAIGESKEDWVKCRIFPKVNLTNFYVVLGLSLVQGTVDIHDKLQKNLCGCPSLQTDVLYAKMLLNYRDTYLSLAPMFWLFWEKMGCVWLVHCIAWGPSHTACCCLSRSSIQRGKRNSLVNLSELFSGLHWMKNICVFEEREKCFDNFFESWSFLALAWCNL